MNERKSTAGGAWAGPLLVMLVASLIAVGVWTPSAVGVFVDDGIYVLLAKALAAGEGLRYVGVPGAPPAPKYPPLYPLLLAAVWKLGPGFPAVVPYLKAVGVACAVLAAGAFTWYIEQVLRFPRWFAVGTAVLAWLTIEIWRYAVVPLSEPVFLLTLLLFLIAAARSEERPNTWPAALLVLAAFAAAYYTRTTGVVLAIAAVGAHLFARRWRMAGIIALGALLIALPWMLWTRSVAGRIPAPLADLLGGYGAHLGAQVGSDPIGFIRGVMPRALGIAQRILDLLLPAVPPVIQLALAPVLLALGSLAALRLWKRSPTLVLTVAGYLGLLCLWPFVARRLIAPVAPLLMLLIAVGVYELHQLVKERATLRLIVRATALLWVLVFAQANATTLYTRGHDSIHLERSVRLVWANRAVMANVPPNGVVVAPEFWAALHLYTGRPVAPSVRFRPASSGSALWGTPEEQLELWGIVGAEYVLLEFGELVHGGTLAMVQETCGQDAVQLLTRTESMHLVRLVMDDRCRAALQARRTRPE